jgi:Na+-transporting NADH:ubiquinone oxidoreductase subunit C
LDRKRNILQAADLMTPGGDIEQLFAKVEPRVVDLTTGEFADLPDPAAFDQRKASRDPSTSVQLAPAEDIAGIKRRANMASVYLVRNEDGSLRSVILPVHGYGLWSTMYGYLALEADANTVVGLNFYQQGETPGLGGEIVNPDWRAQWPGKKVYDESGEPVIRLAKGGVGPATPDAEHKVDALSGATLTSNGVTQMMKYWLGDQGFGPFLAKLRDNGGQANG